MKINPSRFQNQCAIFSFVCALAFVVFSGTLCAPAMTTTEPHAKKILDHIEQTRQAIYNLAREGSHPCAEEKCIFVTFWDFDGTIIHGDITDGLSDPATGRQTYKGLQQLSIEAGLANRYLGANGFQRYREDYERLEATAGHARAYEFIPQAFTGARPSEFTKLVKEYFNTTLSKYYFASSMDIIRRLQHNGVQTHIVSASPEFFVSGAVDTTGIPAEWITGVDLELDGEFMSERIAPPLNYAAGKTERIQKVLAEIRKQEQTDHVYVLAGFGNSHHTDSHFLAWIAAQKLPAGKPLSVMINGDSVPPDPNFLYVEQKQTVREP